MRHGFRMSVGANPDGVRQVNEAFTKFAQDHSLPDAVRRSLYIALDELLANELSHAMAGVENGLITAEVVLDGERLVFTLADNGPEFDPFMQAPPDVSLSVDDRPIGGLGIHLVRELMDEVSYRRRDGNNIVILVKQLVDRKGLSEAG